MNEFNKPTNQSPFSTKRYQGIQPPTVTEYSKGISLRDYFAARAMQAMETRNASGTDYSRAIHAYEIADAMLKAREE